MLPSHQVSHSNPISTKRNRTLLQQHRSRKQTFCLSVSLLYLFVHGATLAYPGSSDPLCCWNRLYHFSRHLKRKHSALSLDKVNLKLLIRQGSSTGFNSVCAAGGTFIQDECSSRTFAYKKTKRYHRIWAFCWEFLYYSSVVIAYEIWKSWINIHPCPLSIICMQHRKVSFSVYHRFIILIGPWDPDISNPSF